MCCIAAPRTCGRRAQADVLRLFLTAVLYAFHTLWPKYSATLAVERNARQCLRDKRQMAEEVRRGFCRCKDPAGAPAKPDDPFRSPEGRPLERSVADQPEADNRAPD